MTQDHENIIKQLEIAFNNIDDGNITPKLIFTTSMVLCIAMDELRKIVEGGYKNEQLN